VPKRLNIIALTSLTLLQACVTGASLQTPSASYFWLPVLGIAYVEDARQRVRSELGALLEQQGLSRGPAFALAIRTDARRAGDGSLGLGAYAGGYAYFIPAPAPAGAVMIEAYDAATLRLVWRASIPSAIVGDPAELRRALAAALRTFPRPDGAGPPSGEMPDARTGALDTGFHASRTAI
jgi:hypothetical protein